MRILHVITGLSHGGAEGALVRLVTAPSRHEHQVVSMTDRGVHGAALVAAGVPVDTLDMPRGRLTWSGSRRLLGILRARRPDVVQTWMYHSDLVGGLIARLAGVRSVVWNVRASDWHEQGAGLPSKLLVECAAWASRWIPSRIIFASEAGARVHHAAGYVAGIGAVVPNGFDVDRLAPDQAARTRQRREWDVPGGQRVIGTVARWDDLKDHATLAEALARLVDLHPPWIAVWIGPGITDGNQDLVSLLGRFGLRSRVRLCGPSADLRAVMNGFDLHVLPSKSEAFANVLAESMACGTPCVATDVGDAAIILGMTGWLTPPKQPAAMATAVAAALTEMDQTAVWQRRQSACRQAIVHNFSLAGMVDAYASVWQDAIVGVSRGLTHTSPRT